MAAPAGSLSVVPPPRLEHYVMTEKLGQGTYATVYKAFKKVTFEKLLGFPSNTSHGILLWKISGECALFWESNILTIFCANT